MKKTGLILALACGTALAASAPTTVRFTAPTTRSDGSSMALAEIDGYNVRCTFTPTAGVAAPCQLSATFINQGSVPQVVGDLTLTYTADGNACFEIQTRDNAGRTSAFTAPVCRSYSLAAPSVPTNVTVAVVIGIATSPVYTYRSNNRRNTDVAGFVQIGRPCSGEVVFNYRGKAWRRVASSDVLWWGTSPTSRVAGPCCAAVTCAV